LGWVCAVGDVWVRDGYHQRDRCSRRAVEEDIVAELAWVARHQLIHWYKVYVGVVLYEYQAERAGEAAATGIRDSAPQLRTSNRYVHGNSCSVSQRSTR